MTLGDEIRIDRNGPTSPQSCSTAARTMAACAGDLGRMLHLNGFGTLEITISIIPEVKLAEVTHDKNPSVYSSLGSMTWSCSSTALVISNVATRLAMAIHSDS